MRLHVALPLLSAFSFAALACSSSSDQPAGPTDTGTPTDSAVTDTGGGDAPGDTAPTDPLAKDREACKFKAGDKTEATLGLTADARGKIPINHIIIVMKENRSFDQYFGSLPKAGRTDIEGLPAGASNPDKTGAKVETFHQTDACVKPDPEHQFANMHAMYDDGKMDGFVVNAVDHSSVDDKPFVTDGKYVMGAYEKADLPFYYYLADTYAVADHYFCSALSGTWSNRTFLLGSSAYGVKNTGSDFFVTDKTHLVFNDLEAAKVTWGAYSDDIPFDYALLNAGFGSTHANVYNEAKFFAQLADGSLPQVAFLDASLNILDEHPPADVQKGEAWTKKVYDAVTASPLWLKDGKGVAMIFTYDESGGFYDHVVPPPACVPSPDQAEWDRLGFRVPFVMISPFAKQKYVSKLTHSHTSITRLIQAIFDLPAMTARDANSDALLDMFDFTGTPLAKPPAPPEAGTGGCK
jgi:phospholipase C